MALSTIQFVKLGGPFMRGFQSVFSGLGDPKFDILSDIQSIDNKMTELSVEQQLAEDVGAIVRDVHIVFNRMTVDVHKNTNV